MRLTAPEADRSPRAAPQWQRRWWQLSQQITRVPDAAARELLLDQCLSADRPLALGFANAHALNLSVHDEQFAHHLASLDVLLRDGIGMAFLLRSLGLAAGLNLNGTDLIPQLIARVSVRAGQLASPLTDLLLLGTRTPWLHQAQAALRSQGLSCEAEHGFLSALDYVHLALRCRPRLIILGMGMPRQENIALTLRASLDFPCLIVCGGAIIDFLGGRVRRAPGWVRALRCEWVWRLACEPRRLFGRYVIGNPLFIARACRLALRARHQAAHWVRLTR